MFLVFMCCALHLKDNICEHYCYSWGTSLHSLNVWQMCSESVFVISFNCSHRFWHKLNKREAYRSVVWRWRWRRRCPPVGRVLVLVMNTICAVDAITVSGRQWSRQRIVTLFAHVVIDFTVSGYGFTRG